MLKLFKLDDDKYIILYRNKELECDEIDVIYHMTELGVRKEEIFNGLEALQTDDMAEYGINKIFVFSKSLFKKSA